MRILLSKEFVMLCVYRYTQSAVIVYNLRSIRHRKGVRSMSLDEICLQLGYVFLAISTASRESFYSLQIGKNAQLI